MCVPVVPWPPFPQDDGSTPLHYACDGGHAAVIEVLLARGANLEAKDNVSGTPEGDPRGGMGGGDWVRGANMWWGVHVTEIR